ncbi:MAG: formate dehydrogenase, partial [Pseudomonadota bacterium]
MKVYVPADSAARSVGSDTIAEAVHKAHPEAEIIRPGSRGLYAFEPLIEVDVSDGRVAYGPVNEQEAVEIVSSGKPLPAHKKYLGPLDQHELISFQDRLTFQRVGIIEPLDIEAYEAMGGWTGLNKAIALSPQDIVEQIKASGLRGRGGAGFPTGIKWQTVLDTPSEQKYIVCNADEGDSGTFADRMIMESDPFCLVEGMVIAGLAVGADHGFIYTRFEYPQAIETLNRAIELATHRGFLGDDVLGSGRAFHLEVREAAGAYICGEETSLLESLEGKRGTIRFRPPLPAIKGLFGQPTVVNNVISLASAPVILGRGAKYYQDYGMGRSRGTLTIQLAGNAKRPGLYEVGFGISLRQVLYDIGGGTASGRPIRAVQAGGPLGAFIPEQHFDTP